eukprot:jgi/Psemu1/42406/gm1.42406_g
MKNSTHNQFHKIVREATDPTTNNPGDAVLHEMFTKEARMKNHLEVDYLFHYNVSGPPNMHKRTILDQALKIWTTRIANQERQGRWDIQFAAADFNFQGGFKGVLQKDWNDKREADPTIGTKRTKAELDEFVDEKFAKVVTDGIYKTFDDMHDLLKLLTMELGRQFGIRGGLELTSLLWAWIRLGSFGWGHMKGLKYAIVAPGGGFDKAHKLSLNNPLVTKQFPMVVEDTSNPFCIEIAFSAESSSDEDSSVISSSEEESSVLSSSSSSSSGGDTKKKYRYKMVVYTDSQVPKLAKGDAGKFEDWYTQFQACADNHKYSDMLSTKAHKDLPPEGQLTPREDMSKAQKKALKYHNTALNDLYKAFTDNSTGLAIMEKSKIDRGRVHHVIEEPTREYRRTNKSHGREQLNIDLWGLKLAIGAPPQDLIEDIYDLQRKYQYKSVSPSPDELIVAFKASFPAYLLMQLTPLLDELQDADTSELELWEAINLQAASLYKSARSVQSRGGKAKEMSLFGAEMTDFANPDTRDKWPTNAVCYWCKEKGHKAYNCEKRKAGHPRANKKTENTNSNGNSNSNNNNNNNSNGNRNNNSGSNRHNGKQRGRRKCGICGGNHRDAVCCEDEKNAARRPAGWKSKLKDVQGTTIDYDFCLSAMQTSTTSLQLLNAQKRATKGDVVPEGFDLLYDDNVFVFDTGATSHSSNSMRCATNLRASGATITTQSGDELKGCQIGDIPCQKIDKDSNKEYQTLLQGVNFNPNFAFNLFSTNLALQNGWIATGSDKAGWSY